MVYLIALLTFVAASSAIRHTAVSLDDALAGGPGLRDAPGFTAAGGGP